MPNGSKVGHPPPPPPSADAGKTPPAGDKTPPASGKTPPNGDVGATAAGTAGVGTDLGSNAAMVAGATTQAASDMAATIAIAAIARKVALIEAFATLMKKGGDALKSGAG
jgi:hypothetical protein